MIDFNIAPHTGNEVKYIQEAIASGKIAEMEHLPKNAVSG